MSDLVAQERAYLLQNLMRHARDYFDIRAAHMYRAKPSLRGAVEDLNHQINSNLEFVLNGTKAYGPERVFVTHIVFNDDMSRRRALLNPTDQNTLINEVIEKADDAKTKTTSATAITSIRSLYGHFDKALEMVVETLQTFQWIDLPDVFDAASVDVAYNALTQILKAQGVPDAVAFSFNRSLNRPQGGAVNLEEALILFFHRMKANVEGFELKRRQQLSFQTLLKREPAQEAIDEANQLIMSCAASMHNARQIQQAGQVSPEQLQAFARAMGAQPESLTVERILAFEGAALAKHRASLREKLNTIDSGGRPVDYKMAQLADFKKRFEAIAAHLQKAGVDLAKEPPKPRAEG